MSPSTTTKPPSKPHGATITNYLAHRCRCTKCRGAWARYQQARRLKRTAAGLCRSCAKPLAPGSANWCRKHRLEHRASNRAYKAKTA